MIGRIYKIQHLDSSLCYVGSTCNTVRDRWRSHKRDFGQWVKRKGDDRYSNIALYPYLEQYGFDRFQMLLIKEYQVADKKQLRAYEQLAISRTKNCCNQIAALQLINANSMARHHFKAIAPLQSERYQANKQVILRQAKEYYQVNKQAIFKQKKEYYQANKERIAVNAAIKVTCECGVMIRVSDISEHRKTAKHIKYLADPNLLTKFNQGRVMCECGASISKRDTSRHQQSAKHARLLAALNAK